MSKLTEIKARHEKDAETIRIRGIGTHRQICKIFTDNDRWADSHQDRAYLLALLDEIAELPEKWWHEAEHEADMHDVPAEGHPMYKCADELENILNK
jgi:hypothetical protein